MEIILYDEGIGEGLDISEIARYLTRTVGKAKVEVRGNPFDFNLPQDKVSDYARKIAGIKIQEIHQKLLSDQEPLYGEIEYERRRILGKTKSFGILYDGFYLLRILCEIIPREERSREFVHIFFTNRLFATWDGNNKRYHLRASVYGVPSVISTTGLVEAPAKPRVDKAHECTTAAGATPKVARSASESICTPNSVWVRVRRATRPSTASKKVAKNTARDAW